jgi:hypothetical protein
MAMKPISIALAIGIGLVVLAAVALRCLDAIMQMVGCGDNLT